MKPASTHRWASRIFAAVCCCAASVALALPLPVAAAEAKPKLSGEQLYRKQCVSCHGDKGEGTKEQRTPLVGDKSILELTQVIDKTMPEGEPELCVGEDAAAVARYIHETFYSPTAQARHAKARIELSRLTVGQYQQSIADLIEFKPVKLNPERGLKAEYFKGRFNDRLAERVDPQVNFSFGDKVPMDGLDPHQFSIRWQGSLLAPETGEYEFTIHTEHGARLWINDRRTPLIDAGVKSGNDTDYSATIKLIRGRLYHLKLEYSKSQSGVKDQQKQPKEVQPSSMILRWKPPQRVAEVIPQPYLTPQFASDVYVVQTPFPPDDRSMGYERGTSISKAWDQATTDAAIEVGTYISDNLDRVTGVKGDNPERIEKLKQWASRFVERAFRRPLTEEQKSLYIHRQFEGQADPAAAVKQVVLLALKSPRFLYRELNGATGDGYDIAARLSFALWDSLPDQELLKAAAEGKLDKRDQLTRQAQRMLGDLRARAKLHQFFMSWLRIDQAPDLAKDTQQFPQFSPEMTADLRTSLEMFVDEVVWSDSSDYRQLMLADAMPLNGRLAQFYGVDLPADAPFSSVTLDKDRRAGVLTHPYLLASLAYTSATSPIHRGVLVSRSMLGRVLRPPPEAVAPLAPNIHPSLTTRERVALQTKDNACKTCHNMINPLGFTLEHFDAVGRYRNEEKGKPIDASGSYLTTAGEVVKFGDVRDLAQFLANSDEAHAAFVSQLFHQLIKQPVRAYGSSQLPELQKYFEQNGCNVRKLVAEIAVVAALQQPKQD